MGITLSSAKRKCLVNSLFCQHYLNEISVAVTLVDLNYRLKPLIFYCLSNWTGEVGRYPSTQCSTKMDVGEMGWRLWIGFIWSVMNRRRALCDHASDQWVPQRRAVPRLAQFGVNFWRRSLLYGVRTFSLQTYGNRWQRESATADVYTYRPSKYVCNKTHVNSRICLSNRSVCDSALHYNHIVQFNRNLYLTLNPRRCFKIWQHAHLLVHLAILTVAQRFERRGLMLAFIETFRILLLLFRRECLVAPWFLWIVLVPCAGD
jgi:hypothetical protein